MQQQVSKLNTQRQAAAPKKSTNNLGGRTNPKRQDMPSSAPSGLSGEAGKPSNPGDGAASVNGSSSKNKKCGRRSSSFSKKHDETARTGTSTSPRMKANASAGNKTKRDGPTCPPVAKRARIGTDNMEPPTSTMTSIIKQRLSLVESVLGKTPSILSSSGSLFRPSPAASAFSSTTSTQVQSLTTTVSHDDDFPFLSAGSSQDDGQKGSHRCQQESRVSARTMKKSRRPGRSSRVDPSSSLRYFDRKNTRACPPEGHGNIAEVGPLSPLHQHGEGRPTLVSRLSSCWFSGPGATPANGCSSSLEADILNICLDDIVDIGESKDKIPNHLRALLLCDDDIDDNCWES